MKSMNLEASNAAAGVAGVSGYAQVRRYFHYAEGEQYSAPPSPAAAQKQREWPGLLLVLGLASVALWLSELPLWPFTMDGRHPVEPVMLAIVFGMLVGNAWTLPSALHKGIKFAVRGLLPFGIILLGARLNFAEILKVGAPALALSVAVIMLALGLMALLTRRLGLSSKLGTLLAVGTAICGGTAIVATAPVIDAEESDVAFGVATVTLLGLVAMFALPVVGHVLQMDARAFGIWAGLAIHQTPQVVAAGFAYGPEAGEIATVVKLTRVCLLAPVVFGIGLFCARYKACADSQGQPKRINYFKLFPSFVLGFLAMALLRTLGLLPAVTLQFPEAAWASEAMQNASALGTAINMNTASVAETAAKFVIVMSMAGVGLETKFGAMKKIGFKPFAAGAATALLITVALGALLALGAIR